MIMNNLILTFSIHTFKCQVFWCFWSTVFNLNAHCGAVFSCLEEKVMYLVGQYCLVCPLTGNVLLP